MSENREQILADFQVRMKLSQYIALIVKFKCCWWNQLQKVCYSGREELSTNFRL